MSDMWIYNVILAVEGIAIVGALLWFFRSLRDPKHTGFPLDRTMHGFPEIKDEDIEERDSDQ